MDKFVFTAGVFLLVVAPGLAETTTPPSCHGDALNATMVGCITENGFTWAQISTLIPSSNGAMSFNANDMRVFCDNKDGYTKATECIVHEINRCQLAPGFQVSIGMNQTSQVMDMICDDPNFKMDCMNVLTRDPLLIQSCLNANYDFAKELEEKTMLQVACESGKVGVKCAADALKVCDEHTANVYASAQSLVVSSMCESASS